MPKVEVPIIFFGTVVFSLLRDGRYSIPQAVLEKAAHMVVMNGVCCTTCEVENLTLRAHARLAVAQMRVYELRA
jgi:hypothetical protein